MLRLESGSEVWPWGRASPSLNHKVLICQAAAVSFQWEHLYENARHREGLKSGPQKKIHYSSPPLLMELKNVLKNSLKI